MLVDWSRLNAAVNAWWRCFPDCRIPLNMKLPVLADEVKADVRGVKVISCSPGTVLLWCGLENVETSGTWDADRYAYRADFNFLARDTVYAIARYMLHPSVCLSVCHTGGSVEHC